MNSSTTQNLTTASPQGPSEEAMRAFLVQGKWSVTADDNISGEVLQTDFIKSLVDAYLANRTDPTTISNLSLIPLALAVAEWGVSPTTDLPKDPADKNWNAVASAGDGKHLMSYSKGGIGVMHQDSGGLVRLMAYIEAHHPDVVPAANKNDFFRLKGINFDKLYAAGGHCTQPLTEILDDLSGATFQHSLHTKYAGDQYCLDHLRPALELTPKDWQVYRHGMREALRHEDVQFRILRDFANNEWASAYRLVVLEGGHDVTEAFVLVRIWNSSPVLAKCAYKSANGTTDTASRILKELNAYAAEGPTSCSGAKPRMKERWPYMQRAVLIYDAFAKK
jgi:hypothetical protein